jgi:hypothetical protein
MGEGDHPACAGGFYGRGRSPGSRWGLVWRGDPPARAGGFYGFLIHTSQERERRDCTSQPLGPVARGIAFGDEPGDTLAGPLAVGERGVKRGTDDLLKHLATEFEVHQKIAV